MTRVRLARRAALTLLAAALAGPALAQAPPAKGAPYILARSEVREMTARNGGAYRIMVSWPEASPPPSGYPVIYILDGDDSFAIAAESARRLGRFSNRGRMTPGLVVAIGYPGPSRRAFDYTPVSTPTPPAPGARAETNGGADAFLDFITDELRPAIERDWKIDRARQTLEGHSYGGLFVLHALFRQPELFQTYVAASPSIWFGGQQILKAEPAFAARMAKGDLKRTLVITVGEFEQAPPTPAATDSTAQAMAARNTGRRMVDNSRDLASRLKPLKASGLAVHYRVFSGETHGGSALPALAAALPYAFTVTP